MSSAWTDEASIPGLPTTAFYDANGKLVGQTFAETSEDELKAKIQELYGITVPAS